MEEEEEEVVGIGCQTVGVLVAYKGWWLEAMLVLAVPLLLVEPALGVEMTRALVEEVGAEPLCAIVRWLSGCLLPCCLVSRETTNQNPPACLPDHLCRTRNRNIPMWKRDLVVLYLQLVKDVKYDCTVVSHCPNT